MRKLTFSVYTEGDLVAKFYLASDAEIFAVALNEITDKKVIVETKDRIIFKVGA